MDRSIDGDVAPKSGLVKCMEGCLDGRYGMYLYVRQGCMVSVLYMYS